MLYPECEIKSVKLRKCFLFLGIALDGKKSYWSIKFTYHKDSVKNLKYVWMAINS